MSPNQRRFRFCRPSQVYDPVCAVFVMKNADFRQTVFTAQAIFFIINLSNMEVLYRYAHLLRI